MYRSWSRIRAKNNPIILSFPTPASVNRRNQYKNVQARTLARFCENDMDEGERVTILPRLRVCKELEKGCELFPETVKAKVRKLYEHADAKRTEREALRSL